MKRVAFVVYRDWAYQIYKNIDTFQKENTGFEISALITTPSVEFDTLGLKNIYTVEGKDNEKIYSILAENKIDVVCYYGWSSMIREPILSDYICLCLHPSPLPKYRGGSPIQNQIIAGEKDSAVSVFRIGEGLDDGDIYKQLPMSLEGSLDDIFLRMIDLGTLITKQFILDLIDDKVVFKPQQFLEENPPLKRRKPEESEIFIDKLSSMSFLEVNNMVRALTDPYPNVFISFPEGKLLLQEINKSEFVGGGIILNSENIKTIKQNNSLIYLKLSDGYAFVSKSKIVI